MCKLHLICFSFELLLNNYKVPTTLHNKNHTADIQLAFQQKDLFQNLHYFNWDTVY